MTIKQTLVLFISLLLSLLFITKANATCEMTGDALNTSNGVGTPVNDVGDAGIGDACSYVPDTYQVEFYRMSLCTSNPDVADAQPDFSSCVDMLADTGETTQVNIVGTNETELDVPDFTIPPGSYPYMVARLSSKLGIQHAFEATTAVAYGDNGGVTQAPGTYCWTVNNVLTGISNENVLTFFGDTIDAGATNRSNMQCSNTEADMSQAEFSYEVVNVNDDNGCNSFDQFDGDRADIGNVGNGEAVSRFMQSATFSATQCNNATSILWTIDLTTPLVVTDTSNFLLNFRTTDAVSIDFNGGASGNPRIVKVGADPIQAYLTLN